LNIELFILRFAFFGFYIHIENNAKKVTDILKSPPICTYYERGYNVNLPLPLRHDIFFNWYRHNWYHDNDQGIDGSFSISYDDTETIEFVYFCFILKDWEIIVTMDNYDGTLICSALYPPYFTLIENGKRITKYPDKFYCYYYVNDNNKGVESYEIKDKEGSESDDNDETFLCYQRMVHERKMKKQDVVVIITKQLLALVKIAIYGPYIIPEDIIYRVSIILKYPCFKLFQNITPCVCDIMKRIMKEEEHTKEKKKKMHKKKKKMCKKKMCKKKKTHKKKR